MEVYATYKGKLGDFGLEPGTQHFMKINTDLNGGIIAEWINNDATFMGGYAMGSIVRCPYQDWDLYFENWHIDKWFE